MVNSDGFNWQAYGQFLSANYCKNVAQTYLSYAKKYYDLLRQRNFSSLKLLQPDKRLHVIKALSCLSKFTGVHDIFKELIKAYDLKWSNGNSDAIILRRLLRSKDNGNDIREWITTVKQKIPRLSIFIDFMTATGLRKIEAMNSFNLIVNLAETNKLNDYYEEGMLEHFRFPKVFLRHTKKAFISIVPCDLVNEVAESPKITQAIIDKPLKRRRIPLRFSDIREYWATSMTRHLSQPEIDFLQGRVGSNTFMQHYFNPTLIHDLKERTLTGIENLTIDNLDRPMLTQKSVSVT